MTRRSENIAPALLTSTSMRGSLAAISAPTRRVSAISERSATCARWPRPGAIVSSVASVGLGALGVAGNKHNPRAHRGERRHRDLADPGSRAGGDDGLALHGEAPWRWRGDQFEFEGRR